MRPSSLLFGALLAGSHLAAARPLLEPLLRRRQTAADIVAAIMPQSESCAGAAFPDECATSVQAGPLLAAAMARYGVYSAAEIAGVLALVAYESVQLAYRHNVSPGTPGQGTSNMQLVAFNALYAASFPELADGLAAAAGDPDAVLALVTPDAYNFGSGPWFLTTQCSADVRAQLQTGTDDGFAAYMGCVGADLSEDGRLDFWHKAQAAFGL